jgi:uncharacterized protein YkwD
LTKSAQSFLEIKKMSSEQEISLSIDETNKMRAALGLAPLAMTSEADKRASLKSQEDERRKAEEDVQNAKIRAEAAKLKKLGNARV